MVGSTETQLGGVTADRRAHRTAGRTRPASLAAILARAVLFGAAWMLYAGKLQAAELACASVCGIVAAFADGLTSARVGARLPLNRHVLRQIASLPRAMVGGSWRLLGLVLRGSAKSYVGTASFDLQRRREEVEGRCALTVLLSNVGADTLVLDVTSHGSEGRLVFHQLDRRRAGIGRISR